MNCFECAKASVPAPAVAICQHCGVGLCLDHLIEANNFYVGGTHEGCGHQVPRVKATVHAPSGLDDPHRDVVEAA